MVEMDADVLKSAEAVEVFVREMHVCVGSGLL